MALLRSVATVGGYTMMSRVLGFVRDMLTAQFLGAGPVADAFFVAFRLPNLFRSFFAEGAFSAAFVPLFAGGMAQNGKLLAKRFAELPAGKLIALHCSTGTRAELAFDILKEKGIKVRYLRANVEFDAANKATIKE